MSPESLWEHCLAALESELPAQQFATWIRPLRVDSEVADELCLIAPNRFVLDWVNTHYLAHIETMVREAQPQASHCLSTRLVSAAPKGRRPARQARRIVPRRASGGTEFDNDYKSVVTSSPPTSRPRKTAKTTGESGSKRRAPPTSALEILSGDIGAAPKQTQLALGDELSVGTPDPEIFGQGMPFEQLQTGTEGAAVQKTAVVPVSGSGTPKMPALALPFKSESVPSAKAKGGEPQKRLSSPKAQDLLKPGQPPVKTVPNTKAKEKPVTDPALLKSATSNRKVASVEGGLKHHANLNADFTFQSFVEGKSNQLGLAAAQQVAENPGRAYNPLYIYGGVGLGKTHLMHAVGNALREKNANAKIVYLHSERFVADMVKALQLNAINDFKRYYRSVDALLIDDIQFFSGKERSQEEFFHTFNALLEGGQQVILTGDRYPREIKNVEERLKSRFSWGLTVAVEPPELETRVAILMKKAEMENIHLPDEAAFFIAHRVRSNVRELEGTLKRVIANARFVNRPIEMGLVRDALKDLLALQDKLVGIDNIQRVVAEYYKIKVADLHSKRRTRQIARPRQIAMSLAKELTSQSLPEIGNAFGGRDHTTVLHACRKVRELERDDADIREDIKNLMRLLTD